MTSNGCEMTGILEASAPLESPAGVPVPIPGAPPCILNGFQLQILPLFTGGALTDWGFYDLIKGRQIGHSPCDHADTDQDVTLQFFDGDPQKPP